MIEQLDAKLQYEEIAAELGMTKWQTNYLYFKALAIGQKHNHS